MFPILRFLLYPILDFLIQYFLFQIFQHPHLANKNQMTNHCLELFNFQDTMNYHLNDQHPQLHSYLLFQNIQIIEITNPQNNIQSNEQKYIITLIMISNILKRLAYTFTQIPNLGGSLSASSQCIKETKRKELNMEDLISICSQKNQEFIRGILNKKQRNRQDKISAQLHKKFDIAMIENSQTDFTHLMFVAALRRSNINNKEIFVKNFLSLFLQKSLKYVTLKQVSTTSTKKIANLSLQSDNPILEQNKQLLLLQATKTLIQLQSILEQKKKQQYIMWLLQIVQKNTQKINSLETILTILECIDINIGLARKIAQSLKYSKIVAQMLYKVKSKFESNSQYTSNIGGQMSGKQKQKQNYNYLQNYKNYQDPNQFRPYFLIFSILSKVVLHDQSLVAYFCGVVAKDGFFNNDKFAMKNRLYFYHRCFRNVFNYVDQNGVNPINKKIIQIQTSLVKQNKLLKYTKPDHLKFYLLILLQLRFHEHYLKLKSQIVGNRMIITQKPTPPYLTAHQKNLLQQVYPLLTPQPGNTLYTLIKTHYPFLIPKSHTSKPLPFFPPPPQKQQRQIKYIHNELMNRMGRGLQKLKIKYNKQIRIEECGKNVDFLLVDDKIVIQCDGDYHIDFNTLSISVGTSWRNMLLMLVGYRVVEFGMHQFHLIYNSQNLDKILMEKLQILKNHQAYVVS